MKNFLSKQRTLSRHVVIMLVSLMVFGCANNFSHPPTPKYPKIKKQDVGDSYTLVEGKSTNKKDNFTGEFVQLDAESLRSAPLLRAGQSGQKANINAIHLPQSKVSLSADNMPLENFINLALGDVLKVNYIVDADLAKKKTPITLRINTPVDSKRMLGLIEEVLLVNNIALVIDDDVIKVIPSSKTKDAVPGLLDRSVTPLLKYGKIAEIIPIYYLSINDAARMITDFLSGSQGGKVLIQHHLYSLMIIATREDLRRIYQLLAEIDLPLRAASHMALMTPHYVSQENMINDLKLSLSSAGVPVYANKTALNGVILFPLSNNTILITASTKSWLKYTLDWAKQLDKPKAIDSGSSGIYVYYMQNTKAADAWAVVSGLFGDRESKDQSKDGSSIDLVKAASQQASSQKGSGGNSQSTFPGNSTSSKTKDGSKTQSMSVITDKYRVIVDTKQNSIFFTGEYQDYQRLLELLRFVDKRPRQVLLQAVVAEISLTDNFNLGFDYTASGSDVSGATTLGSSGYLSLTALFGDITAKFGATAQNLKTHVLSNPRVIVMDQETAKIDIGDQIQVKTGSVTSTESGATTDTYQYVSTGISLEITPSINENGLVELEVDQQVSSVKATDSSSSSSSSSTSPSINKRSLKTKMLANNGDTVYMGGLISDTDTSTEKKVPLLGDVPLLGSLFKYSQKGQNTTELVLLITPYVINSRDDALFYTKEFKNLTGWELADYAPESLSSN